MTFVARARARTGLDKIAIRVAVALLPVLPSYARAELQADPGLLCRGAIRQAEAGSGLPANLLAGIARVESGRRDPATGQVNAWPWTINAEGKGTFFDTKAEAIAFAKQLRARGVQSFDAGCLQVNLMYHPDAFASLEEAFDPAANARYAVRFLQTLKEKLGSWDDASAWYHSANPEYGIPYRGLVVSAMAEEAKASATSAPLSPVAQPAVSAAPMAISSMPSRPGNLILLSRAGLATPAGGQGITGRGLDAYRSQPITIVGFRRIASQ